MSETTLKEGGINADMSIIQGSSYMAQMLGIYTALAPMAGIGIYAAIALIQSL